MASFDHEPDARYSASIVDDWELSGTLREDTCGHVGVVTYGYDHGVTHFPRPCFVFACRACGPTRSRLINRDMASHWSELDAVYLYRFGADDPTQTEDQQVAELAGEHARVVDAIRSKIGGAYLWLRTFYEHRVEYHVFASVDFSSRRNRGRPGRCCDRLSPSDAISHLDLLLSHGIRKRDVSSKSWPLTDGERSAPKSDRVDRIALGQLGVAKALTIEATARELYAKRPNRGSWPAGEDHPRDMSRLEAEQLYRDAVDALRET